MTDEAGSDSGRSGREVPALVQRWARQGLISAEQAEAILRSEGLAAAVPHPAGEPSTAPAAPPTPNRLAVEALAYLGGVLAVAAGLLLVQTFWDDLSDAAQVLIPLAATAGLLAAGAAVPRTDRDSPGSGGTAGRLRSVLWLMSLIGLGTTVAVLGGEVAEWEGTDTAALVGVSCVALGAALYVRTRSVPQHLGLFVALALTAAALTGYADWDQPPAGAVAVWLVALGWLALGDRELATPGDVAVLLGAGTAVAAMLFAGEETWGQLLAIGTVAALFLYGVVRDSLGVLAVAALGTLGVVPSAVGHFFPDNTRVVVPLSLLLVGGVLVTTAVLVARRRAGNS